MKVLVVDDNATNRKLLSKFLKRWGYEPVTCSTGEQAVDYCRGQSADLILMDIMMPGMGGQEAAREIKAINGNKHIPIIYVTALKEDQALAESLQAGGDDFVTKPIDQGILVSKITAHMRIRELNRELEQMNLQLQQHNRRLEREQELIRHFFERQEQLCDLEPAVLRYRTSAASAFNGDILFAQRRPRGGANIIVGDFTGHGLTAAMGSLPVSEIFTRLTAEDAPLHDLVSELNRCLCELLPAEIFLAANAIQLSPDGAHLSLWTGGLPPALLRRKDSQTIEKIESRHLPLGIVAAPRFDAGVVELEVAHGDCLYLFTDGLIEATDEQGNIFGEARVLSHLRHKRTHIIERVCAAVSEFTGRGPQADDISFARVCMAPIAPVQEAAGDDASNAQATVQPFSVVTSVDAQAMRSPNSLAQVVDMLASSPLLRPFKGVLYTIISELYTNALEHGILGLDSTRKRDDQSYIEYYGAKQKALDALSEANIRISCTLGEDGRRLTIQVRHDGSAEQGRQRPAADGTGIHGWGLNIVQHLCESVDYRDGGRCVEVTYDIGARDCSAPH